MGSIIAPRTPDRPPRTAQDGRVPRFVLLAALGSPLRSRLAELGWNATVVVSSADAVQPGDVGECDVLVAACTERDLLHPAFHAGIERVAEGLPRVAVVAGAGPDAAAYAARLAWQGFVPAEDTAEAIALTIARVADGELSFPREATHALVRALARFAPVSGHGAPGLTPRQQQIATLLQISRSTAHKHVQNARRRLGAKTRSHLVATSRDLDLASPAVPRRLRPAS